MVGLRKLRLMSEGTTDLPGIRRSVPHIENGTLSREYVQACSPYHAGMAKLHQRRNVWDC